MRFVGQGYEIPVPLPAGTLSAAHVGQIKATFDQVYQALYERLGPPVNVEIINWRVVSSGPKPDVSLDMTSDTRRAKTAADAQKGARQAYHPETAGFAETPIYDRYRMQPGMTFDGPAIVEERESTVIVGPASACSIDDHYNLVVKLPTNSGL
jgi:N-methylhydantoinase A